MFLLHGVMNLNAAKDYIYKYMITGVLKIDNIFQYCSNKVLEKDFRSISTICMVFITLSHVY